MNIHPLSFGGYLLIAFGAGLFVVDSLARLDGWNGAQFIPPLTLLVVVAGLVLLIAAKRKGRSVTPLSAPLTPED